DPRRAGDPGRRHAVEGVAARLDAGEQVLRLADPQQVPGPILGQLRGDPADDRAEALLLDGTTDAEAVERERGQTASRASAQVLVLGALDDPVQRLAGSVRMGGAQTIELDQAALRPCLGALE